jgi:hypothetical protein
MRPCDCAMVVPRGVPSGTETAPAVGSSFCAAAAHATLYSCVQACSPRPFACAKSAAASAVTCSTSAMFDDMICATSCAEASWSSTAAGGISCEPRSPSDGARTFHGRQAPTF